MFMSRHCRTTALSSVALFAVLLLHTRCKAVHRGMTHQRVVLPFEQLAHAARFRFRARP